MSEDVHLPYGCVDCRAPLTEDTVFAGGLCQHCALKANPLVCLDCRGQGRRWVNARDELGNPIQIAEMCVVCMGDGVRD